MRVLHVVKTSTGATWALRQMKALVARGFEIHVALPDGGPLIPEYVRSGIKVHFVSYGNNLSRIYPHALELKRIVDFVRPQVVHSHFFASAIAVRFALGRWNPTPRVFQVPGPLHLEHYPSRVLDIASAGEADRWIASCNWTYNEYQQLGVPESRLGFSYYGVSLADFMSRPRGKLRAELAIPAEMKLVGMVAFAYPPKRLLLQRRGIKGHEDFFEALSRVLLSRNDVLGVVIGGAWGQSDEYFRRLQRLGRVLCGDKLLFLGTRSDVLEIYRDLDVVIHPSHSENLGGALESLLLEVPTIATSVGGFPDLVEDGKTGWLVPPHNPEVLANRIVYALDNEEEAKSLASSGARRARQITDIHRCIDGVVSVYTQSTRFKAAESNL